MMMLRSNRAFGGGTAPMALLHRADRGDGVHRGAHAADALREGPGVARVAAAQDQLDAAEHGRRRPSLGHGAAVDFRFDAQVTLDPGDRIDNDVRHDLGLRSVFEFAEWLPMRRRTTSPTPCSATAAATRPVRPSPTGSIHLPTSKPATLGSRP